MAPTRRRALALLGASIGAAGTAGCFGSGDGTADPTPDGDGNRTPTDGDRAATGSPTPATGGGVHATETLPYTLRTDDRPAWLEDDGSTGRAVVIDDHERARAALRMFEVDAIDGDAVRALLQDVDYERDRLVLVSSAGPDACHATIEVGDVRVEDGRLHATAAVVDESGPDEDCAAVLTVPETLLRVTFVDDPVDEVAIEVTDGWDETATVVASPDDSLSPAPADLEGHVAPESDPEPVASLACDDPDFERHSPGYDEEPLALGEVREEGGPAFALRVEETTYDRGDVATVELTSLAEAVATTGNADKYNLEVYTEAGWQDVRGGDGPFPYTDEGVSHAPGTGFTWRIELTADGVVADAPHDLRACPDLPAGRYRFAYWGVGGEGAVAVEFELVD